MSKFDSARDELLYVMTLEGWANESSGESDAPMGFFARISNSPNEIAEIRDAFPRETVVLDDAEMIGHFLCQENSQGFWYVESFDSEYELKRAYRHLDRLYSEWASEDG
jgi:hypothetical protein